MSAAIVLPFVLPPLLLAVFLVAADSIDAWRK